MSGMDGAKASARRNAYAKITHTCACGRILHGNLAKTHLRACETNLSQQGWPLDESMKTSIRAHYYGHLHPEIPPIWISQTIHTVEKELGRIYLNRRAAGDKQTMLWREYRDTVSDLVTQAVEKAG
jgi:hypothetical protein